MTGADNVLIGKKRVDVVHHPLDPMVVAAPPVMISVLASGWSGRWRGVGPAGADPHLPFMLPFRLLREPSGRPFGDQRGNMNALLAGAEI